MTLRTVVFWLHLLTGLVAGAVILTMSLTGVLLAFAPQIVERAERDLWRAVPPALDVPRLPMAVIVAGAQERRGGARATTISARHDPRSSVRVGFGREGATFVNPYTGGVVGPGSTTHQVMHVIEDWHRWLGSRDLGRPITGVCNLAFLGLAISGPCLWWPRAWSRSAVRAVTVVDLRRRGRARDFNWHNAIGVWSAPMIIVLTLTGAVMSYQWANDLLYRLTGNEPPPSRAGLAGGRATRPESRGGGTAVDLDALYARATRQTADWVTVTLRLPQRPGEPVTAFIQEPPAWPPSPRSVLTLDAGTAEVTRWEPFSGANGGRTLRVLARMLHTGEVGGVIGQLVAALASAGGAGLVHTGAALAWRRYRAWTARGGRLAAGAGPTDAGIVPTSPSLTPDASQRRKTTVPSQPAP